MLSAVAGRGVGVVRGERGRKGGKRRWKGRRREQEEAWKNESEEGGDGRQEREGRNAGALRFSALRLTR